MRLHKENGDRRREKRQKRQALGPRRHKEENPLQGVSWLQGHKMQRVPTLPQAAKQEAVRLESLPLPEGAEVSLLCLKSRPAKKNKIERNPKRLFYIPIFKDAKSS